MNHKSIVPIVIAMALVVVMPATAAARVKITKIQYDPPGSDNGSNKHLNKEFIVLKNTGGKTNLKGWRIRDNGSDHVYKFRSRLILRRGRFVTLRTGAGRDDRNDRFWRLDNYVWNNDGDRATLVKPSGRIADRCGYEGGSSPNPPKDCN